MNCRRRAIVRVLSLCLVALAALQAGPANAYSREESIGLQLGVQRESVVIVFMSADALRKFRESKGFKIGIDGSVAIANLGAGDALDTETIKKPVIGFIFSNQGLMVHLTLEGSKITQLKK